MALNVREIAEAFAEKSAKNEPNITEVYLFPSEKELRIIEIDQFFFFSGTIDL